MAAIVTECGLFVTSQCDIAFTFPNQRFDQACWRNMHISLFYRHSSY